jgi:quinol monooxygenase YgiN
MIALTHFDSGEESAEGFSARAEAALAAFAARPGYLRGTLGRSMDDPRAWLLLTEWDSVGAYRRALGNFDVRINATPLLSAALDIASAFEPLVDVAPGGAARRTESDRSEDREAEGDAES